MKKFFISVFILAIFAGAIYLLGMPHLAVPAGSWGVMETKISGIKEEVISGQTWDWHWYWEKVLPTVTKIYVFRPQIFKLNLENPIKGQIFPSAKDYAAALDGNPDFSFDVYYYLEFFIRPDHYPQLVKQGVYPDTLDTWSRELAGKLGEKISRIILADPEILYQEDFNQQLTQKLSDDPEFGFLDIQRIIPARINVPDYELYKKAKEHYFKMQQLNFELKEQRSANELAKLNLEHQRTIEAIKKEIDIINNIKDYGAILTNYPILLQFLSLRSMDNEDILQLSRFGEKGGE